MSIDLKIVAYNIFEGGANSCHPAWNGNCSNRLDAIVAYLRSLNSTVIILTELNHFDCIQFSHLAKQWNHSHSAFLSASTGFHLGISSSCPLIELHQLKDDMHHGALFVQVNLNDQIKIGVIATHLNPFASRARTIEAQIITDQLKKEELNDWIIAGDLNSLSEDDANYYEPSTNFTITDKLKAKFLTGDVSSIDYTTLNHFIEQGYRDTMQRSDQFKGTVPTKLEVDPMHALKMRLDYILTTKILSDQLIDSNVLDNEQTAFLSDHYPIMASFLI